MARILIVEDQDLVRRSMRLWLEQAGHQIEEATDGAVGIQRLRGASFDLVVTDISMPNLEGLQLIRWIRREQPALAVIAASGVAPMGGVDMLKAARNLGADESLAKPFTPRDLNEAVFRCLGARRAAAALRR